MSGKLIVFEGTDGSGKATQSKLVCEELDKRVLGALEKLPPKDRSVIREYIRVLGASALRLTEIACETM